MQQLTNWDIKKKSLEQELKELQENKDIEILSQKAMELKAKKETLVEEVDKFAKKSLAFFLDLRNQVTKDLQEMAEIRDNVVENSLKKRIEKQKRTIETLQKLTIDSKK